MDSIAQPEAILYGDFRASFALGIPWQEPTVVLTNQQIAALHGLNAESSTNWREQYGPSNAVSIAKQMFGLVGEPSIAMGYVYQAEDALNTLVEKGCAKQIEDSKNYELTHLGCTVITAN